jgi:hypothetical protein
MRRRIDDEEQQDQPQETGGFNMENPSNVEGKNHGHQQANLHYIRCVFTTPNGG